MIKVSQGTLLKNIKTVGELITNRVVALDTSYLKLVSVDGTQYLVGMGSQHDLILKVAEEDLEDFSVNVDYTKMASLVSYLKEEITLEADNEGVLTEDGTVKTYLSNIMSDNTDIEDITNILEESAQVNGNSIKVNTEDFYNTLRYLRGIQERDERTDIETGIMFTSDYSYVVGDMYAARHNFGMDLDLVLDGHTTRVLAALLQGEEVEEFRVAREDGVTFFLVGEHVYRVDGLTTIIDDRYEEIFGYPDAEDVIKMEKSECLRILNLTNILTDKLTPDITFKIQDNEGRIYTSTQDGDEVDSKFKATECGDKHFTVDVGDMLSVIGKLPQDVAEELHLEVIDTMDEEKNRNAELIRLKHELGDSVFSINFEVD